jgi:hypothetical protein
LEEKAHNIKKAIHKMGMSELEEKQLAIFENYMASLSSNIKLL